MMDDPAFAIDMPPPLPDFDFAKMDLNPQGDSQRSSQSMLSIRRRSGSIDSHASSIIGLDIPSSNGGSYQLPLLDPFATSSAQKPFGAGLGIFNDEEDMVFQDEELFEFGADGEFRDIPESERDARRRAVSAHPPRRPGSDAAASGRVRKEHEDALAGHAGRALDFDGDYDMPLYHDDDLPMFPGAEPFPAMTGGLGGHDVPLHLSGEDRVFDASQESSVSAEAPMKKKKAKKERTIKSDQSSVIPTREISQWQKEYIQNMEASTIVRVKHQATLLAKKNAFHYVYGSGISDVGGGVGSSKLVSPLAMFSGAALFANLTGKPIVEPKSKKRPTPASPGDDRAPHKRAREDEIGRGEHDDENVFNVDDDQYGDHSIEIGRDAQGAMADHPPSAMPWNMSSSLHSHQRGHSSSVRGRIGVLGSRRGSVKDRRLTSPLIGRGSNLPGELDLFSQMMNEDEMVMYGRSDDGLGDSSHVAGLPPGFGPSSQVGHADDFEMFGAAADVDTQTASSSQWMKDIMDRESGNFFEYVKNTIDEKSGDELGDAAEAEDRSVTFAELFATTSNTSIVAAQAFYHVLTLATKRRVWVEQDVDGELFQPFGEIRIGVLA